jgi:hypothetical protein
MKMLVNCPCCNDPLLNEFYESISGFEYLRKKCTRKLDHYFMCVIILYKDDNIKTMTRDDMTSMVIRIDTKLNVYAVWNFQAELLMLQKGCDVNVETCTYLDFFVPDLSNYKKLVKKLNTYKVFS